MLPYLSMQIEMQMVVRSREVRELIEEYIKGEDPKAFTEEGVIKSYKIDYGSVYHNPMGGVEVEVYMNKDKEQYIYFLIDKYNGRLELQGTTVSKKIYEQLEEQFLINYNDKQNMLIAKKEYPKNSYSLGEKLHIDYNGHQIYIGTVLDDIHKD